MNVADILAFHHHIMFNVSIYNSSNKYKYKHIFQHITILFSMKNVLKASIFFIHSLWYKVSKSYKVTAIMYPLQNITQHSRGTMFLWPYLS